MTVVSSSAMNEMQQQIGEGCRIHGNIRVNKVPGNFHISMHGKGLVTMLIGGFGTSDASHIIHSFSVYDESQLYQSPSFTQLSELEQAEGQTYQYYLKFSKAISEDLLGFESKHYEVSAHWDYQFIGAPAIYFRYDLEPITMKYSNRQEEWRASGLLVSLCAIIGGTYALMNFLSQILFKIVG